MHCYTDVSEFAQTEQFHLELIKLMDPFKNNGYLENFINKCF